MKSSPSRIHRSTPSLESLEHRLVLDNTTFVNNLYHDVLQRAPDAPSAAAWVLALNNGTSRQQVATSFWESREHRTDEVNQFYQTFLHRTPDASGQAALVNLLQSGAKELDIEQIFLNSAEYKMLYNTNTSYVDAVYGNVLGRAPTAAEDSMWVNYLAQGNSASFLTAILNSQENDADIVGLDYTKFLLRNADAGGQSYWTSVLQNNGQNTEQVATAILSSAEYFALSGK